MKLQEQAEKVDNVKCGSCNEDGSPEIVAHKSNNYYVTCYPQHWQERTKTETRRNNDVAKLKEV